VLATGSLVGRRAELAAVDHALDLLVQGQGGTLVIAGEPGIGKTRLLAELVDGARARGCPVLDGRATEFERDEPYAVFRDLTDGHLRAADRLTAHVAVRELLARRAPVVVALDDMHWADPSSIDLFGYLVRQPPIGPVLIAAALRPARCPSRLVLALDAARRRHPFTELALAPLTRAESAELLDGAPAATVDAVHADSGGNPFYLHVLANAQARGGPTSSTLAAALAAELRALSPVARQVVSAAAVAGDPFDPELATAVARLDPARFHAALDEAVAADLIRPTDVAWRLRFRHPIVRRAVYESAGPGWRRVAHARATAELARRGAGPLARAGHVERSAAVGDLAAVAVLADAGHAAAATAPAEAAHWFRVALDLVPCGPEHVTRRLELLQPLALNAGAAGRLDECAGAVDSLLDLVPAECADARVRLVALRVFVDHAAGRHEPARALATRELHGLPAHAHAERAALHLELGVNAMIRADHAAISAHAVQAHALAGSEPLRAAAGALAALGEHNNGRSDRADAYFSAASTVVEALPDDALAGRLDAALLLSLAGYHLDRHADAIRHAARGLRLARATGQVLPVPALHVTSACAQAFSGRLSDGLASATAAYEASILTGSHYIAALAKGISGWIHTWRGSLDEALACTEEALHGPAGRMVAASAGLFRAEVLLELGRPDEAQAVALEAGGGADLPALERPWRPRAYQALIRAALARGDSAAARRWLARARADAAGVGSPTCATNLRYAEAAVLLDSGEAPADAPAALDAAAAALEAAAAADRAGRPVEAGRARILAGRALAAGGRRRTAVAELLRAERDLASIGAERCREQAARELRRLGRRTPDRGRGRSTGLLSARESEVARLVAAGHTNRQIASTLVISDKTVEAHVSRILRKLSVPTRAAVGRALAGS
jgi:DNA-binding CsgD family transcriptional regulator